jgi:hypothetical protein
MATIPKKQSSRVKFKQGQYIPSNPHKYAGDITKIRYMSSWEKKAMDWFDQNPAVLMWNSEDCIVKYFSPIDNKDHRYLVDFVVKIRDRKGVEKTYAIEIKPYAQTVPPTTKNKKKFITEMATFTINTAKWEAARRFFEPQGVHFLVMNEFDLGIKK